MLFVMTLKTYSNDAMERRSLSRDFNSLMSLLLKGVKVIGVLVFILLKKLLMLKKLHY
jgi:hypothetical protein